MIYDVAQKEDVYICHPLAWNGKGRKVTSILKSVIWMDAWEMGFAGDPSSLAHDNIYHTLHFFLSEGLITSVDLPFKESTDCGLTVYRNSVPYVYTEEIF